MKINELIHSFQTFMTNEEKQLFSKLNQARPFNIFNEREKIVLNTLIKKNMVLKYRFNDNYMVRQNERRHTL